MPAKTKPVPRADMGSQELTEEIIRLHAYQLFQKRGCEPGHALEDWLQAEAEVMGMKPAASSDKAKKSKTVSA